MANIITRASKTSPLTFTEMDSNLTNLNAGQTTNAAITGGSAQNIAITYSSVDSTPIGANLPAAATFTNLSIRGTASGITGAMIGNTPAGNIVSTTVQAAINELDTKKVALANLAAPTGSSLVGYQPAGTGAVARTVASKLGESVSVKDFGAVGDGVTNDTAAIQAAINSGAKTVHFPSGTYNISASITVPPTSGNNSNIALIGDGMATIIQPSAAMTDVFYVTGKDTRIKGILFNNIASNAANGVRCVTTSTDADMSAEITECRFINFTNGISAAGQNYNIEDNFFNSNTTHINIVDDGRNSIIGGNYFLGGNHGITTNYVTYQAEGLRIINNTILITGVSGTGINLNCGLEVYIGANIIDQCGTNTIGIYISPPTGRTVSNTKIIGNWIAGGSGAYSLYAGGAGNNANLFLIGNTIVPTNGLAISAGISLTNTNGYSIAHNSFMLTGGGSDLSSSGTVNGTVVGNISTNGSSPVLVNSFSQNITTTGVESAQTMTAITFETAAGTGPTLSGGSGDPAGKVQPPGSIWLRSDGGSGGHLYISQGAGSWTAVTGV